MWTHILPLAEEKAYMLDDASILNHWFNLHTADAGEHVLPNQCFLVEWTEGLAPFSHIRSYL